MKNYRDSSETALWDGSAKKTSARIEAIGTVDELNSFVALARSRVKDVQIEKTLHYIQRELFILQSDLANPKANEDIRITEQHVEKLEELIERFEAELAPMNKFKIPGGTPENALLHVCRTITRRAERNIRYINRLSDVFFALARLSHKRQGVEEEDWLGREGLKKD
jgi:cob(I)alamin adenosyltransferase